jgi:hypothetical protein
MRHASYDSGNFGQFLALGCLVSVVQLRGLFTNSVFAILVVTANAKLLSVLWSSPGILAVADPLLQISTRSLLLLVGVSEIGAAIYLLLGGTSFNKLLLILWFGLCFGVYRLGLLLIRAEKPCSCLGTLDFVAPIGAKAVDLFLKSLIAYMIVGSLYFLYASRQK